MNAIADEVMDLANNGKKGRSFEGQIRRRDEPLHQSQGHRQLCAGALFEEDCRRDRKDEFYDLVSNYAAALFVYYLEDFRGTELEIKSTTQQGKFTVIMSAIKLKGGGREQVRWRLVPAGGGFRINDVNLKGVWMTISMKDRFTKVLTKSKGDFEPLFAELREAETW